MGNNTQLTAVVGMSGGVDSSVAAYLLKEQGYRVIGLFMKNWEEDEHCNATSDYEDVISVCEKLQIPHYTVNFAQEYWNRVFARCLAEYNLGHTPNPDILCNREIKFDLFLQKALDLGADFLATGHYCRNSNSTLCRGLDANKDQSYFLYTLKKEILDRVLFPLGDLEKPQVRALAEKLDLVTAQKKDSTGICFVGKRNFKTFLTKFIPNQPGNFESLSGEILGRHDGIAYYTIGQRRGLHMGGQKEPWYVVGKDAKRNVILLAQGEDHPALHTQELVATETSWVTHEPTYPLRCTAKVRYRSPDEPCTVYKEGETLRVVFDEKLKAVTPRQSIVFYQRKTCLGGAFIQ